MIMFFLEWLWWCLSAYWEELIVCQMISLIQYQYGMQGRLFFPDGEDFPLFLTLSLSLWLVYCGWRQGYALG